MEFAGGGPGMEGKDPDEVIEQLKNGVKKALENTDQTKRELIQGIIEFVDHGDAEMAGLRVAAIEADPASYLQSKKKTENSSSLLIVVRRMWALTKSWSLLKSTMISSRCSPNTHSSKMISTFNAAHVLFKFVVLHEGLERGLMLEHCSH